MIKTLESRCKTLKNTTRSHGDSGHIEPMSQRNDESLVSPVVLSTNRQTERQTLLNTLDAGHSIECKLTPATRSPEICFALCDPVTLTFDLLT